MLGEDERPEGEQQDHRAGEAVEADDGPHREGHGDDHCEPGEIRGGEAPAAGAAVHRVGDTGKRLI